jgi:hypothetical protein
MADRVGLALMVVLDRLAPPERLAFVLHDVFAVSEAISSNDHAANVDTEALRMGLYREFRSEMPMNVFRGVNAKLPTRL